MAIADFGTALRQLADLGGPVVMVLIVVSILTGAVILFKIWQLSASGVGRHRALQDAVQAWEQGDPARAEAELGRSKSYLVPVIAASFGAEAGQIDRLRAEAEDRFSRLERGFRFLDSVAQLSPLLGLFGTVLGMIEAFQALQDAGNQVDPSLLAGGIWVALLTTAVGLAVAMPTSMVLSWFESRMAAERVLAERAIQAVIRPRPMLSGEAQAAEYGLHAPAHG